MKRIRWTFVLLLAGAVFTTLAGLIGDNDTRVTHGLLLLILAAVISIGYLIDDRTGGAR